MQASMLSAQIRNGSEQVDCHRDATSVPCAHFLINLSPRTDDQLRYCTKIGSVPSKFYNPDDLKKSNFLDDEHIKSLYSPSNSIVLPQWQKSLPSVLLNRIYQVPLRMYSKFSQRKPAKYKKTSRDEVSKRSSTPLSLSLSLSLKNFCGWIEVTLWRLKKCYNSKKSQLLQSLTFSLDKEQFGPLLASVYKNERLNTQAATKQVLPKYQTQQNPTNQTNSLEKEINKKLFAKADSLADEIFSSSRVKLSNSQILIMDGVHAGVLLSDLGQQLHRKKLTLLVYLQLRLWIKMPRSEREEVVSLSK